MQNSDFHFFFTCGSMGQNPAKMTKNCCFLVDKKISLPILALPGSNKCKLVVEGGVSYSKFAFKFQKSM